MDGKNIETPEVFVRLSPHARAGIWAVEFDGPWCPRKRGKPGRHFHGGGDLGKPPVLGYRESHCLANGAPDYYELVLDAGQPQEPPSGQ